jgi:predicted RND superfamily exporter protein
MATRVRSALLAFIPPLLAIVIAFATGYAWLGRPLRLVQLVTIIGLGLAAGVAWAQAVQRVRQHRSTTE